MWGKKVKGTLIINTRNPAAQEGQGFPCSRSSSERKCFSICTTWSGGGGMCAIGPAGGQMPTILGKVEVKMVLWRIFGTVPFRILAENLQPAGFELIFAGFIPLLSCLHSFSPPLGCPHPTWELLAGKRSVFRGGGGWVGPKIWGLGRGKKGCAHKA